MGEYTRDYFTEDEFEKEDEDFLEEEKEDYL
jgi:hypothetical protein